MRRSESQKFTFNSLIRNDGLFDQNFSYFGRHQAQAAVFSKASWGH